MSIRLVGGPCAAYCAYGACCVQQRAGVTKGGNFEQFRAPTDIDRFGGELDDDALCQMLDSLEVSNSLGLACAAIDSELDIAYVVLVSQGKPSSGPSTGQKGTVELDDDMEFDAFDYEQDVDACYDV